MTHYHLGTSPFSHLEPSLLSPFYPVFSMCLSHHNLDRDTFAPILSEIKQVLSEVSKDQSLIFSSALPLFMACHLVYNPSAGKYDRLPMW